MVANLTILIVLENQGKPDTPAAHPEKLSALRDPQLEKVTSRLTMI